METMVLEVPLSKDPFSMLGSSKAEVVESLKEFSILGLYLERRISAGKAANLMGISKREFVRRLARRGIPYFDYTVEELEGEFLSVGDWKRENSSA